MKILIDFKEKCLIIIFKKTAYSIARHGRPFGNLWEIGWYVSLYKNYMPFFAILKYEKF